jgi:hypothetical protein
MLCKVIETGTIVTNDIKTQRHVLEFVRTTPELRVTTARLKVRSTEFVFVTLTHHAFAVRGR